MRGAPYEIGTYLAQRRSAFGFLASKEVKDAGVGNLGLQDRTYLMLRSASFCLLALNCAEREALRWVQKYIHAFGGDRSRVTM